MRENTQSENSQTTFAKEKKIQFLKELPCATSMSGCEAAVLTSWTEEFAKLDQMTSLVTNLLKIFCKILLTKWAFALPYF